MSIPFQGCWQRIERAEMHREALSKIWNDFIDDNPYSPAVDVDADGAGAIFVIPVPSLPPVLGFELGEMLYQFRAALDGCIYQAAILESDQDPPPNEKNLEFPICASEGTFKLASRKIPLEKKRCDIVESVQPYNAPPLSPEEQPFNFNRTLGILNDWARKDRHRKLHVVGSWFSNASPKLSLPLGVKLKSMSVLKSRLLEHENKIAIFSLDGWVKGMKVNANPNLTIDIAVNEVPAPVSDRDHFGQRCLAMSKATRTVVRLFEKSFSLA